LLGNGNVAEVKGAELKAAASAQPGLCPAKALAAPLRLWGADKVLCCPGSSLLRKQWDGESVSLHNRHY